MEKENRIVERSMIWKFGLILTSWAAFISFDFLLHAGLLANMYMRPNPAVLGAQQAFYRIPFGYSSFLVFVMIIYWLLSRIGINEWKRGFLFGIKFGALLGATSILGLYSILTINFDMLIGWGFGQTIEFGIVGGIIGGANSGVSLRRLLIGVAIFMVATIVLTIILQNVGLAPSMIRVNI